MRTVPVAVYALVAALLTSPVAPQSAYAAAPLSEELNTLSEGFAQRAPAAMREAFAQGIDEVRESGVAESAKNVGDQMPDGELLDADGQPVRLSSLWAEGPVVVTFYRGGWCPYCNLQLRAMQRSLAEINGAGARLVAITPELPEKASETATKNELDFVVLTDKNNTVAHAPGIAFTLPEIIRPIYQKRIGLAAYNGNDRDELPLAATYVVGPDGVIRWAFLDADYKKRAEPAEVVAAVKGLAKED